MSLHECSTWLEIDLSAITNNLKRLKQISDVKMMAVVKANAYGHGIYEVAMAAVAAGTDWLGVARLEEALLLRNRGVECPIQVLGWSSPAQVCEAAAQNISLTVFDRSEVEIMQRLVAASGLRVNVHLKVETGMGRLGVFADHAPDMCQFILAQSGLRLEGIFTHFARADEPDVNETSRQIGAFNQVLQRLDEAGLRPPLVHAANSAGNIYHPAGRYDMVRCGIAMYGLAPSPQAPLPDGFRPALSWKGRMTSVRMLRAGSGISYNHRYRTSTEERIGTLAVGYADGLRRGMEQVVLVGGRRVSVVGTVCMDQCMLQLDQVPGAAAGDEVVLIGRQGDECITAEELAARWGTINYEVTCGLANRLPRYYFGADED